MKTCLAALAGAMSMVCAGGAGAVTIVVEQTVTVGPLLGPGGSYSPDFGPTMNILGFTGPVQFFSIGDTLDWRLKLPTGDAVTFSGLHSLGIAFSQIMAGQPTVTATGSISFRDGSGNLVLAGSDHTFANNTATAFYESSTPAGDNVTASEIDALIRIDSFSPYSLGAPPTGSYFTQPYIYFVSADSISLPPSLNPSAGAPEPSTWALMLGGFGMLGATLRRRSMRTVS